MPETHLPSIDVLVSAARILKKDELPIFPDWCRNGSQTGRYAGPPPTYTLIFNWTDVADTGPVQVINKAMEACFGVRGIEGWELWISGDQLRLVIGDFKKEYARVRALEDPQLGILDLWIENLLQEVNRV
jgi:hypothetical protein